MFPYPPPIFADRYPISVVAGLLDLLLIVSAANISYWLRFNSWAMNEWYLLATFIFSLSILLSQAITGCYGSWRGQPLSHPLGRIILAWTIALSTLALLAIATQLAHYFSRYWILYTLSLGLFAALSLRFVAFNLLGRLRAKGRNQKKILLISDPTERHAIFKKSKNLPAQGYSISQTVHLSDKPIFLIQLLETVRAVSPHEIWICLSLSEGSHIKEILHALRHQFAEIRFIPDISDISLLNHKINTIAGMYTIDISYSPMGGGNRIIKRIEDLILGSLISLLILPMCLIIYIAIKLTSKGPAIFKQNRLGFNGKSFKVYKFRSMQMHYEIDGQTTQATINDPRVTPLGLFLRKTSLDELPQFYNVLQGHMSIVGPRPHALAHNEYYKDLVGSYMQRHKVKPGITGWAQVNGLRGQTDTVEKMQKRIEHDLWYINNWSVFLDLKIIGRTILTGFINNKP